MFQKSLIFFFYILSISAALGLHPPDVHKLPYKVSVLPEKQAAAGLNLKPEGYSRETLEQFPVGYSNAHTSQFVTAAFTKLRKAENGEALCRNLGEQSFNVAIIELAFTGYLSGWDALAILKSNAAYTNPQQFTGFTYTGTKYIPSKQSFYSQLLAEGKQPHPLAKFPHSLRPVRIHAQYKLTEESIHKRLSHNATLLSAIYAAYKPEGYESPYDRFKREHFTEPLYHNFEQNAEKGNQQQQEPNPPVELMETEEQPVTEASTLKPQIQQQTAVDQYQTSWPASAEEMPQFLNSLTLGGYTSSKVLINGKAYRWGQYIDPWQRLKVVNDEGRIYIEAFQRTYPLPY